MSTPQVTGRNDRSPSPHPYTRADLPVQARVKDLLGRMTTAEKIGQMMQLDPRAGEREVVQVLHAGSVLHVAPGQVQRCHDAVRSTRLQIPLLVAEDCIHGHSFWPGSTIFPSQLGMAGSWDVELVERVARATAVEAAATGVHWTFSPVLCVARDPRWGRVGETFGEDLHLVSELGAAMVRGYQGCGLSDRTALLATAKHFVAYSETHGGRDASESDVTLRKLRSWFLPPFQRAVAAGCRTIMLGYQSVDGVPMTVNRPLLVDLLRDEWSFSGLLVTDWDNVGRLVNRQQVSADHVDAAVRAVRAGNDFIMATPEFMGAAMEAVERGDLDARSFDPAVERILTVKFELGLFEDPRRPDVQVQQAVLGSPQHAELNLLMARASLVLLSNDGLLPLAGGLVRQGSSRAVAGEHADRRHVAVLGPNADDVDAQLGDWAGRSGQVDWLPDGHPREFTQTVVDGLRELAPSGWTITHRVGASIVAPACDDGGTEVLDGHTAQPPATAPAAVDDEVLAQAVDEAARADYAVVVVGDRRELVGEGRSTATLDLIGAQVALLDAVERTGTPVAVVLMSSKPLVLPASAHRASALLYAANPGMRGGHAVAEVLLGLIEPSGRLAISFPRHAGQLPVHYTAVRGQQGGYADLLDTPAFAFGQGLSYTQVQYSDLRIENVDLRVSDTVRATVTVRNVGRRPTDELVQVYVSDSVTSATWVDKELKAYVRVPLQPGERREVELRVPVQECSIVDSAGRRIVEAGAFELLVGPDSRDEVLLRAAFRVSTQEPATGL